MWYKLEWERCLSMGKAVKQLKAHIFWSCPVGQTGVFDGLILATRPAVFLTSALQVNWHFFCNNYTYFDILRKNTITRSGSATLLSNWSFFYFQNMFLLLLFLFVCFFKYSGVHLLLWYVHCRQAGWKESDFGTFLFPRKSDKLFIFQM